MAEAVANEQGQQDEQHHGSFLKTALLSLVLLYLAGFALVIIDTIFLDEKLWSLIPVSIQGDVAQALQTVYAPLIWLLDAII